MSDDNPLSPQAPILGAQVPPVAQQVINAEELRTLRGIPHCCKCGCGIVLEQQRSIEADKCNDCFKYERMDRRLTQVEMIMERLIEHVTTLSQQMRSQLPR